MSPAQYRAALERLELSNAEVAPLLGYSRPASHSYSQGQRPVPGTVEALLALTEALGVARVRRILGRSE